MTLVVQGGEKDDEDDGNTFESNTVSQERFGEYVASMHSCNNRTFILQHEVYYTLYFH